MPAARCRHNQPRRTGSRTPGAFVLVLTLGLIAVGCDRDGQSPAEPESTPALAVAGSQPLEFRLITAGSEHSCGVTANDIAYCWGDNRTGALGNGSLTNSARPVAVAGGLRFAELSAGISFTCGVTTDDRAYCWGSDVFGQLGDGSSGSNRLTPFPVAGQNRFVHIRAGYYHTCAITPFGGGFCWGWNYYGQLGDNTRTQRLVPTRIHAGGLRFRQLAPAGTHTCGLATDSRAYCWGLNEDGQLGDGTTIWKFRPTAVIGGHTFRQVVAGSILTRDPRSTSCGVATDSHTYCWGDNTYGQLGDGTKTRRTAPRLVHGGLDLVQISVGGLDVCGATRGNVVYCWGWNFYGQLGDGTFSDHSEPAPVAGTHAFSHVAAAASQTCALTTDDRAYCWGSNAFGELGNGTIGSNNPTPGEVLGPE
jgi:alpha-tubulin suppressor-like RCC1 family protein